MILTSCGGSSGSPSSSELGNPSIIASITVTNIPATVTYDMLQTPDNIVEYTWEVKFDMDSDGDDSVGDLKLILSHGKRSGELEKTGPITDFDAMLLEVSETGPSLVRYTYISPAELTVLDNKITLTVNKSVHASLHNISSSTKVTAYAAESMGNSHPVYFDKVPSYGIYSQISDTPIQDNINENDVSEICDITTLTVHITN